MPLLKVIRGKALSGNCEIDQGEQDFPSAGVVYFPAGCRASVRLPGGAKLIPLQGSRLESSKYAPAVPELVDGRAELSCTGDGASGKVMLGPLLIELLRGRCLLSSEDGRIFSIKSERGESKIVHGHGFVRIRAGEMFRYEMFPGEERFIINGDVPPPSILLKGKTVSVRQ